MKITVTRALALSALTTLTLAHVGCDSAVSSRARDGALGGDGGTWSPGDDASRPDPMPGTDAQVPDPDRDGGPIVPPPPPLCDETPTVEPSRTGTAYYFSDCASGAAAGCVPGDDASPGTSPDAPRRTPDGMDLDGLPGGTQLLFARGGAWDGPRIVIHDVHATPSAPIIVASYAPSWGGTARPWIRSGDGPAAVEIGSWSASAPPPHGGYHVEGIHFDGAGVRSWGVWIRDGAQHVTVRDCEIEGYELGLHFGGETRVAHLTIRDNHVHHNSAMGMLGHADDLVLESNHVEANNFSGSGFNHGIYLGGRGGVRLRARNNLFDRNSVVGGRCTGGNFTMHGHWEDAVIESNTIIQDASDGGCYGFSITPAYNVDHGPESFRDFVMRGNTVVNLGNCAFCAGSAPGIVIENNVVVSDRAEFASAIQIPGIEPGEGDVADEGAVIRNNTFYWSRPARTPAIHLLGAGGGIVAVSNLVIFAEGGPGAACFEPASDDQFATVANNLCHGGVWSREHETLASAQAAGLDLGGLDLDPALVAAPVAVNGWDVTLADGSPAIDAGHPSISAATDRACGTRSAPDIGASEHGD